jgi:hypothetical protein
MRSTTSRKRTPPVEFSTVAWYTGPFPHEVHHLTERVADEDQDSDNPYPDDETNIHNRRLRAMLAPGQPVHEILVEKDGRRRRLEVKLRMQRLGAFGERVFPRSLDIARL